MNKLESNEIAVENSVKDLLLRAFPILLFAVIFLFASCYVPPSGTPISDPVPVAVKPPPAAIVKPPPAQVYFYPKKGQTPERQDRDRYECYTWAMKQTGFDPNVSLSPGQRRAVIPAFPPGYTGAVSNPARQDQAKHIDDAYPGQDQMHYAQFERKGMDFRRAMSACLEGRGYIVK